MKNLSNVTITVNSKVIRVKDNMDDAQKERQIMMIFCINPMTCNASAKIGGKKHVAKMTCGKSIQWVPAE